MGETINNIKAILDQIRPFLQRDGGDIEFGCVFRLSGSSDDFKRSRRKCYEGSVA